MRGEEGGEVISDAGGVGGSPGEDYLGRELAIWLGLC